ncbi:MAG TPA: DUF3488 and transglutaminase-like domain-containing protein [Candidatus Didemnitutus sp.]|nr:DUF3488 and transglutaminase-like domain-containing protein [Candidatus Didemnitutus sp.]
MSMGSRPPQLSLDELRRLKWLLGGVLALVSLWTIFFLDVEALALVAIAGGAIAAAMIWPGLPARIPALLWRLSVPAIIITVAADFFFSSETLPVLIRLAVLLVLYRALSYRRRREDLQLILLGLFLIVVAGVLTVSLGFAFLLLLFTACTLGFLFAVTLIDAVDTGPTVMRPEDMREVPAWARGGWGPLFRRLRQVADWRLLALAGVLFTVVVGLSGILFLTIPRFELATGFFLDKYITRKSHSGFTDTVRFGDVSELVKDDSVALRVDLGEGATLRGVPYWRMVVLDDYRPSGFGLSTELKNRLIDSQQIRQYLPGRGSMPGAPVHSSMTVYVEPGVSRFLPLPGRFGGLRLQETLPLQGPEQGMVALRTEAMAMVAFHIESFEAESTTPDTLVVARPRMNRYAREVPPYDPGILTRGPVNDASARTLESFVQEITGGRKMGPTEFAARATDWLRARHAYALSSHIPPGPRDDIVKWLDSHEPGFCEYFASALTVLCRSAGFPAVVVAGFHGGTLNAFENYYMVKNSDAHAWVEVYDGRGAWFRSDPTPGERAVPEPNEAAAVKQEEDNSWSARFDSLRILWYRRIVNFDSRQQVQMVDDVKSYTTALGQSISARLQALTARIRAWLTGPWNVKRAMRTGAWILGLFGGLWLLRRAGAWAIVRWRQWRRPGEYDPVRREAGRWLVRIRATALSQPFDAEVLGDLQRLRYGPRPSWPDPQRVFRRARKARRNVR